MDERSCGWLPCSGCASCVAMDYGTAARLVNQLRDAMQFMPMAAK